MGDFMSNVETEKLLNILNTIDNESTLKEYINASTHEDNSLNLSEYIMKICKDKAPKKSDIIKNADIYRTYGYEILSGKKLPSRDKLLKLSIGNEFTLKQCNRCLTLAKLGILYAKNPRDSIIIFSLNNTLSLIDTNILLDQHSFQALE